MAALGDGSLQKSCMSRAGTVSAVRKGHLGLLGLSLSSPALTAVWLRAGLFWLGPLPRVKLYAHLTWAETSSSFMRGSRGIPGYH